MPEPVHCVVCHGEITGPRWLVEYGDPDVWAHPDCHRLAFDREPIPRACTGCGPPLRGTGQPIVVVGELRMPWHARCWFAVAPGVKAADGVN